MNSTMLKTVALAVAAVILLNKFEATRDLIGGGSNRSFF
jgi:hypothetical protein